MDEKVVTVTTYNESAQQLADYFNSIGSRTADIEKALELAGKAAPKVVEIGCGNGRDAAAILVHANDYTGMDISHGLIRIARQTVPAAHFVVADIVDYHFPPGTDIVFAFASLLHSDKDEVASMLRRAHAAMTDGGIVYISLKFDRYQKRLKRDRFGARWFYFYTPDDIKQLAPMFQPVHEDVQFINGSKWFTLALRRV